MEIVSQHDRYQRPERVYNYHLDGERIPEHTFGGIIMTTLVQKVDFSIELDLEVKLLTKCLG